MPMFGANSLFMYDSFPYFQSNIAEMRVHVTM